MTNIVICVVVFSACVGYVSALNCTTLPDGNYELGCRSYATCVGGNVSTVDCDQGMVYNGNTGLCDDPANVPPPCGVLVDCSSKADGRYPDLDQNCTSYHTCKDNDFLGHNFCPDDLVFDETLGICNWANAVSPPCGTHTG